jgi:hypothetical protein
VAGHHHPGALVLIPPHVNDDAGVADGGACVPLAVFSHAGATKSPLPTKSESISKLSETYALAALPPTSLAVIVISALSRREMGHPALAFCAAFSNAAASAPGIFAVTSR